jgi:ribonuclease I
MGITVDTKLLCFCALLFMAAASEGTKLLKHTSPVGKMITDSNYDFYLFATEWAGTACKFNSCNQKIDDSRFNVHGLWPSSSGSSPENCDRLYFDESNISPELKSVLYNYWNGCYKDSWDFIRYELKKHGTCWSISAGNPQQMDQGIKKIMQAYNPDDEFSKVNTYMSIVVFLSQKMNPYKVLQDIGLAPGDGHKFPINQFIDVFNKNYGLTTGVIPVCLHEKSSGEDYIAELRFCLDLNYSPIDCDPITVKKHIQTCGADPVFYPKYIQTPIN